MVELVGFAETLQEEDCTQGHVGRVRGQRMGLRGQATGGAAGGGVS